ncbi:MAG: hypothetical protein ABWX74_12780 [Aeromicrobium sp.]
MGELQIDAESLRQVRTTMVSVESLLDRAATRFSGLASADVGPPALVTQVRSFGEDWTDAIEGLATFADSLAHSLDIAEKTYADVDDGLSGSVPEAS